MPALQISFINEYSIRQESAHKNQDYLGFLIMLYFINFSVAFGADDFYSLFCPIIKYPCREGVQFLEVFSLNHLFMALVYLTIHTHNVFCR